MEEEKRIENDNLLKKCKFDSHYKIDKFSNIFQNLFSLNKNLEIRFLILRN